MRAGHHLKNRKIVTDVKPGVLCTLQLRICVAKLMYGPGE